MILEELKQMVNEGRRVKYLLFWGHKARAGEECGPWCLSQWFPSPFEVSGVRFLTAEHYMMAGKATLFGDEEMRSQIIASPHPGAAKKLGRRVRGFVESTWEQERYRIVVDGNTSKFGQDPELKEYLLNTGERVLVEASPRDRIWGIGMGAKNPSAMDPLQWKGLNLLGFALMEARDRLRAAV